jgi:shikimate kinase
MQMLPLSEDHNIVLIGMPGVGKSTVGVLLSKATSRAFLDTDVYIQSREGKQLQDIIDAEGIASFCEIEKRHVLALERRHCVIATGGSVVYSEEAMAHLKDNGVAVHLDLALPLLEKRLTDLDCRGVVMSPEQTLRSLFEERQPLYQRHADITIGCAGRTHEEVVAAIMATLDL